MYRVLITDPCCAPCAPGDLQQIIAGFNGYVKSSGGVSFAGIKMGGALLSCGGLQMLTEAETHLRCACQHVERRLQR